MVKYARGTEGFFKPGEDERIVKFLSATQTPEAAQTRLSSTLDLTREGRHSANRVEPKEHTRFGSSLPTLGVTVIIAAVFMPLMWRRPKSPSQKAAPFRRFPLPWNRHRRPSFQIPGAPSFSNWYESKGKRTILSVFDFVLRTPKRF